MLDLNESLSQPARPIASRPVATNKMAKWEGAVCLRGDSMAGFDPRHSNKVSAVGVTNVDALKILQEL